MSIADFHRFPSIQDVDPDLEKDLAPLNHEQVFKDPNFAGTSDLFDYGMVGVVQASIMQVMVNIREEGSIQEIMQKLDLRIAEPRLRCNVTGLEEAGMYVPRHIMGMIHMHRGVIRPDDTLCVFDPGDDGNQVLSVFWEEKRLDWETLKYQWSEEKSPTAQDIENHAIAGRTFHDVSVRYFQRARRVGEIRETEPVKYITDEPGKESFEDPDARHNSVAEECKDRMSDEAYGLCNRLVQYYKEVIDSTLPKE